MPLEVTVIPCLDDNYGYLLHETTENVWAVVDVPDAAPLRAAIDAAGGKLDLILITHHHADHIQGVAELVEAYGAKTVGHGADAARLPSLDVTVSEGDTISVGAEQARIVDVSGHTIGHIAYCFEGAKKAFTADGVVTITARSSVAMCAFSTSSAVTSDRRSKPKVHTGLRSAPPPKQPRSTESENERPPSE